MESMWKKVSSAVDTVREEGTRVVKSFPMEEITESVSKLATASSEELSRYGKIVKDETDKISSDLYTATRCQVCDKRMSTTLVVTKVKELVKCSVCGLKCCPDCLKKSKEDIPDHMWHSSIARKDIPSNGRGPYCVLFCRPKLVDFWLTRSCAMLRQDFLDTLELYLKFNKTEKISKPFATKDGHYRKGKRLLTLAGYAADVIGYKQYVKLITYVAQGHGILSYLLENDYVSLLYPLMELLEGFGIKGPDGLLRVWYYACHCELQRKMNVDFEHNGLMAKEDGVMPLGVISATCPQNLLDYAGSFMGPAQWLYSATDLPFPHSSDEWTRWYLSRLVGVQGWNLLASSVTSTDHYDVKCPAFALVARQGLDNHEDSVNNETDGPTSRKEALLVIRGSRSVVDWNINMNDKVRSFTYWRGTGIQGDGPLEPVRGFAHEAMLEGCLKILDLYGMRDCLSLLLENGFDVKIVGHSLGASTACLLAAAIKNGYAEAFNRQEMSSDEKDEDTKSTEGTKFNGNIPRVVAVGFGCPPCVDSSIGDAMQEDDMFLSVVHRDDLVPRLSRRTLESLAEEVIAYSDEAARMKREDTADFKEYALTYGLAHDMSERKIGKKTESLADDDQDEKEDTNHILNKNDMGLLLIEDEEDNTNDCKFSPNEDLYAVNKESHDISCKSMESISFEENTENEISEKPKAQVQGTKSPSKSTPELVVPGKIIFLSFSQGGYRATLCNHRLKAFSEIIPIQSAMRNHYMRAHIEAMRSLRLGDTFSSLKRISPPTWQPIYNHISFSSLDSKESGPESTVWARCYVCDTDPTWPYITTSDASRGMAVHNCRSCGRVVCSVCAPARDKIPADGVGKYQTLSDNRISLPFMGLTDKQRVCTPCFLHSYERITSIDQSVIE